MRTKQMPGGMRPKVPDEKKRKNKLAAIEKKARRSRRPMPGFNNTGLIAGHVVEVLVNDEQQFIMVGNATGSDDFARRLAVRYLERRGDLPENAIIRTGAVLYFASGISEGEREEVAKFFIQACQERLEKDREREKVDLTLRKELESAETKVGGESDQPSTAESGD